MPLSMKILGLNNPVPFVSDDLIIRGLSVPPLSSEYFAKLVMIYFHIKILLYINVTKHRFLNVRYHLLQMYQLLIALMTLQMLFSTPH